MIALVLFTGLSAAIVRPNTLDKLNALYANGSLSTRGSPLQLELTSSLKDTSLMSPMLKSWTLIPDGYNGASRRHTTLLLWILTSTKTRDDTTCPPSTNRSSSHVTPGFPVSHVISFTAPITILMKSHGCGDEILNVSYYFVERTV